MHRALYSSGYSPELGIVYPHPCYDHFGFCTFSETVQLPEVQVTDIEPYGSAYCYFLRECLMSDRKCCIWLRKTKLSSPGRKPTTVHRLLLHGCCNSSEPKPTVVVYLKHSRCAINLALSIRSDQIFRAPSMSFVVPRTPLIFHRGSRRPTKNDYNHVHSRTGLLSRESPDSSDF